MKPDHIWKFYRSLRARGMSLTKMAAALQTKHSHLSQVVTGARGGHTRRKMVRFLTLKETELLGWEERGEVPATEEMEVPQGTMSHVEHGGETAGIVPRENAESAGLKTL